MSVDHNEHNPVLKDETFGKNETETKTKANFCHVDIGHGNDSTHVTRWQAQAIQNKKQ